MVYIHQKYLMKKLYSHNENIDLKPPINGWKRLIHQNDYHWDKDEQLDLECDILKNELEFE